MFATICLLPVLYIYREITAFVYSLEIEFTVWIMKDQAREKKKTWKIKQKENRKLDGWKRATNWFI